MVRALDSKQSSSVMTKLFKSLNYTSYLGSHYFPLFNSPSYILTSRGEGNLLLCVYLRPQLPTVVPIISIVWEKRGTAAMAGTRGNMCDLDGTCSPYNTGPVHTSPPAPHFARSLALDMFLCRRSGRE